MTRKTLALLLMCTLIILATTGCGLLDKMLSIKDDFQRESKQSDNQPNLRLDEIIVDTPEVDNPQEQSPQSDSLVVVSQTAETTNVKLYFTSANGENLVEVQKNISKAEGIGRATVNALLEGPDFQSGLIPSVPAGTRLLDINIREDGLCIVDFSSDIIANMSGGEKGEQLTVYAITNTLSQFASVDRVEFRVEGQKMDTLLGFTSLDPAVTANTSLVSN